MLYSYYNVIFIYNICVPVIHVTIVIIDILTDFFKYDDKNYLLVNYMIAKSSEFVMGF